jgi:HEAT repeat protein
MPGLFFAYRLGIAGSPPVSRGFVMVLEGLTLKMGLELGTFVWENVLKDLIKGSAEDLVKDFFKEMVTDSVAALHPEVLKRAMGRAIGEFLKLFLDELEAQCDLTPDLQRIYETALKGFIRDRAVRSLLGVPFGDGAIDAAQLTGLWVNHQPAHTSWPENFDWARLLRLYGKKVQGIIRTDPDLRPILELELSERSTALLTEMAGPIVGFDLTRYRESLLEQYGALKLESLGASKYEKGDANYRSVKLWNVFVAQTVREFETVAPQWLEIPKERLRLMQGEGLVDGDLEAVWERQKERYFDSSPRSVLEICADPQIQYQVVLGDPGAGKSTLVRYLAVEWARHVSPDADAPIPLLIELRRYIQSKVDGECKNFLEFIHQGSNWVGNLNQGELDRILAQGQVLVMFDGLDEVVERGQRGNVLKAIHSFSQNYPQARIMVTSRVIGYRAEDLREAGFRHFMLQDLNRRQMQQFVEDWHNITYGDAGERGRKQGRLERAIDRSKAIFELAGNPLLLTLMAILNRGEELPRDRVRLYEKAAEVLLFQWDFEEKEGLTDPRLAKYLVELDFRDKRAMLQRVAYEMQSSSKGLAGNFVTREVLEDCLVGYLRERKDAAQAPSIAGLIIDQLRERNFILCYLGGDNYAFIHRTFLEYFCATEIVERFGKRGTEGGLTFEQLRDEVFGAHWQDPTWHEVLRLICGEIAPKFAGELIEFLMKREVAEDQEEARQNLLILETYKSGKATRKFETSGFGINKLNHLLIAADCLEEVRDRSNIIITSKNLLLKLQKLAEIGSLQLRKTSDFYSPTTASENLFLQLEQILDGNEIQIAKIGSRNNVYFHDSVTIILSKIALIWGEEFSVKQWFFDSSSTLTALFIPDSVIKIIAQMYGDNPETLIWLKVLADRHHNQFVRCAAVKSIAQTYRDNPETLIWLKERIQQDDDEYVRSAAVRAIVQDWKHDPETLPMLKKCVQQNDNSQVHNWAMKVIVQDWKNDPDTLPMLKNCVQHDDDSQVRNWAMKVIIQDWKNDPDTLPMLENCVQHDDDSQVRNWAMELIVQNWKYDPDTLRILKNCVQRNPNWQIRRTAVSTIVQFRNDDPDVLILLKNCIQQDDNWQVRSAAVIAIAKGWKDDPKTLPVLKDLVQQPDDASVRQAAVKAIAEEWENDPDAIQLLLQISIQDPFEREGKGLYNPRQIALQALLHQAPTDPQIIELLRDRSENDNDEQLREWAKEKLKGIGD